VLIATARGAGAMVGRGGNKRVDDNGNLYIKKSFPIMFFLFSNNVDPKSNNRNYREQFSIFWVRE